MAKTPVDLLDFTITDSRNIVELQPAGYAISGVTLAQGMRVVFANDFDPTVRNKIFVVNIVNAPGLGGNIINLALADDSTVDTNNNLVVLNGPNKGVEYYYNGTWIAGQQKTGINQAPLFDVIDSTGVSIGTYTNLSLIHI